MHFSLSFLLLFFLETAYLEKLKEIPQGQQGRETFVADHYSDGSEKVITSAAMGVPGGLSSEALSELHNLVKDISHPKGIYRKSENKAVSEEDLEIRRSVLRKIAVASESDAIKDILKAFSMDGDKMHLLEQMEFLVHQYDVAVSFATQGGIQILAPFLFVSDDKIVSSVASVLGASMQSNPIVQKLAVEHDVVRIFLKLLSHQSLVVLPRILFALSCLLRNIPEAQEEFILLDGVSKLADVLKNDQISTNNKLKIVNLFNDLAIEQQTVQLYSSDHNLERILKLQREMLTIYSRDSKMALFMLQQGIKKLDYTGSHQTREVVYK